MCFWLQARKERQLHMQVSQLITFKLKASSQLINFFLKNIFFKNQFNFNKVYITLRTILFRAIILETISFLSSNLFSLENYFL